MKLKDLKKYDGKEVIVTVHGKHISGKLKVLEHTVKIENAEIMPGQIVFIEEINES